MRKCVHVLALVFACVFFGTQASAGLLDLTLTQNGNTSSKSFESILDLTEFDQAELQGILSGYTNTQNADLFINYRGVPIVVKNTITGNTSKLVATMNGVEIYNSGTQQGVEGGLNAFADQFKDNPTALLDTINKEAVKSTPYDPVAGNPSSFLYRMMDSSYNAVAYDYTFRPNISMHNLKQGDKDATAISLNVPLGFTVNFTDHTGLTFDIPITATTYDGSLAADVSFGLAWRQGIITTDKLELGIAVGGRAGAAASLDLGTAGVIWSVHGSLKTKYNLTESISIKMVNNVGYYNAPEIDLSDIVDGIDMRIPYQFTTIGLKNSIAIAYNFTPSWSTSLMFIDTRFLSFEQYISYYDEVRIAFEYDNSDGFIENTAIYAGYKFGEKNYNGFEIGIGFSF